MNPPWICPQPRSRPRPLLFEVVTNFVAYFLPLVSLAFSSSSSPSPCSFPLLSFRFVSFLRAGRVLYRKLDNFHQFPLPRHVCWWVCVSV